MCINIDVERKTSRTSRMVARPLKRDHGGLKRRGSIYRKRAVVGSEDFGETLNRHGETGNGPDADVEHFPTTEKKGSLSYADVARGTKRYVSFE